MEIDRGGGPKLYTDTHTYRHTHTHRHTHTDTDTHTPAAHFISLFFFQKRNKTKKILNRLTLTID